MAVPFLGDSASADDDSSQSELDEEDVKAEAAKTGKRAGIPELELDALPSTIMAKVLTLNSKSRNHAGFV